MDTSKKHLFSLALFLVIQVIGEAISCAIPLSLPGNLIGLLMLFLLLYFKIVKLEWVEESANFLLNNLVLLFLPLTVSVFFMGDLIASELVPILGSMVFSTLIIMVVTAKAVEWTSNLKKTGES